MDYIEGRTQVPLPTYFVGDYGVGAPKVLLAAAKHPANSGFKMDGLKICENLYWLKGSGKFTILGIFFILALLYIEEPRSHTLFSCFFFSENTFDSYQFEDTM